VRTNAILFWILTGFFLVSSVLYTIWGVFYLGHIEWSGGTPLGLAAVLSAFIAFYLGRTRNAQGGELPEDRVDGNVDDADPEMGFFSPWSWWPFCLSAAAALAVLGLAVGFWILYIGLAFGLICLVGWTYEYYRGYHAR
jgi:hypothetical protein